VSVAAEGAGDSTISASLLADFLSEWADATQVTERLLIELEGAPSSIEHLHGLFRAVHSMKSNLKMLHLDAAARLLHAIEDVLHAMREGRMAFEPTFGDLVLLSVERVRICFTRHRGDEAHAASVLGPVERLVARMAEEPQRRSVLVTHALTLLDPWYAPRTSESQSNPELDLAHFRTLAQVSERRAGLEEGSTLRMEQIAAEVNLRAGLPIPPIQLSAAVLLHDFCMSLLPLELLKSAAPLSPAHVALLQSHPARSAALLDHRPEWAAAQQIILQHHERHDGSGYPAAVPGDAIHPGARLLAMVDTFEAITQDRSHKSQRRPVLRALTEINAGAGSQFDPQWVQVFNDWARQRYLGGTKA
jgi:HD-GYP domain-containing protein (c-di-GMP phosphodiesterase class II)